MLVNIIIIIALARNNSCMNSDRWGILVYRGFHITFDEWVPKFVRNFRSSLLTWQFHYVHVVVNQLMSFETKLWISLSEFRWEVAKCASFDVVGLVI